MSSTCVKLPLERAVLQLKHVTVVIASMPRICVIGAGAGAFVIPKDGTIIGL